VRAPKVHQLCSHPDTQGPTTEAAWWIAPASVQFRISARTHVLPASSNKLHSNFPLQLLSSAGGGDSGPDSPETADDWEKFRIKTFNALPPFLRASFARPIPGSSLQNPDDANVWPSALPKIGKEDSEEDKSHIKDALENFALLVLEPLEVEYLELGVEPNRRTQWKLVKGEWREKTVVP
jgi:pyridoxamine 5'-phosphate oxidase